MTSWTKDNSWLKEFDLHLLDSKLHRVFREKLSEEVVLWFHVRQLANTITIQLNRIAIASGAYSNHDDILGPDLRHS